MSTHCLEVVTRIEHLINDYLTLTFQYRSQQQKFLPQFSKRLDHLETLVTICRPKTYLSAGSLCRPLVPNPQSKCPKRTFMLPQKYHVSVSNMLSKPLKCFMESENEHKFQGPNLSKTPCKVLVQRFLSIMPQISTKDSDILFQLTKNAKTNNNIVCYHLVSRCVISTPQMFSVCIDAPKGPSYYPQNIMLQFQVYYYKNYYAA